VQERLDRPAVADITATSISGIDLDELTVAIQETFQMWFEILEEREREAQRASKTGTGGFFG
jgi:hypothetical protein